MTPRIYYPHTLTTAAAITLDESASRHLLTVLRLKIGEPLQIFNGLGGAYSATLQATQKNRAIVAIKDFIEDERESPLKIHLGQVISRGERMDFTVQKSVELGVNQITPLFSERCGVQFKDGRAENRLQHWQKIAISASEQCGRCRVPEINYPQSLADFFAQTANAPYRFICSLFDAPQILPKLATPVTEIALLIGPEGGFTSQEVHLAQQAGFCALSLGPRILRTETAAITAITLLQHLWGDLML